MEPMTMAVREESGSFCCSVEETADGADDAVEDVILPPALAPIPDNQVGRVFY
jgi:hypothetical protein